jgi:hypothetical protein
MKIYNEPKRRKLIWKYTWFNNQKRKQEIGENPALLFSKFYLVLLRNGIWV